MPSSKSDGAEEVQQWTCDPVNSTNDLMLCREAFCVGKDVNRQAFHLHLHHVNLSRLVNGKLERNGSVRCDNCCYCNCDFSYK